LLLPYGIFGFKSRFFNGLDFRSLFLTSLKYQSKPCSDVERPNGPILLLGLVGVEFDKVLIFFHLV
jgi:hypothetical protein